ncbi:MAG: heparinase II/III family protein [Bacteroidota bacterium]
MLASIRSGSPQRITYALENIKHDALSQTLYANLYKLAGSEPSSQIEASAAAKALGLVLLAGCDDKLIPLSQQEFTNRMSQLEQLLLNIDPAVSNVAEEFQWRAVELMQFATAYDFYRAARGEALPAAEQRIAAFADNAVKQLRNGFVVRNNLSVKLAAAAGYAALILRGETLQGTQFTPEQWFETAFLHIESTLFEYQSSPDGYYGYSEGPWYFRYAMQNLIPFFLAIDVTYDGGVLVVKGKEVRSPLRDPKYLRLFEWIATLRMPDGMLPPFEDTYMNAWFPEAAMVAAMQPDASWLAWSNFESAGKAFCNEKLSASLSRNFDARVEYLLSNATPPTTAPSLPLSRIMPEAGYAVFRSSWNADARYFALIGKNGIARTHRSPVGSGHKHANETAFILQAGGEMLAIEPGYYNSSEREELVFGRNHNIVLVDGKGPDSTSWGTFLFGVDAFMSDTLTCSDAGMVSIRTSYQSANIERRATVLGGTFVVLADRVSSTYPREFTDQLHGNGLASSATYAADCGQQKATWTSNAMSLHAVVSSTAGAPSQTTETRRHAPAGGQFAEHSALYSTRCGTDVTFHSLLIAAPSSDKVTTTVLQQCEGLSALSAKYNNKELLSLLNATGASTSAVLPSLGMVNTDASAFHCVLNSAGRPDVWMLDGGSFIQSDGRLLLSSSIKLLAVLAFEGSSIRLHVRGDAPATLQLFVPFTVATVSGKGIAHWERAGNMLRIELADANTDVTISMTSVLTGADALTVLPQQPQLFAPYPQPLTTGSVATCTFTLPGAAEASLSLWDALGRLCSFEQQAHYQAGTHTAVLPTTGLHTGVYFIRLQSGSHVQLQRLSIR